MDQLKLNVSFLRKRVPNLTVAAKKKGLRPATVSNLCTGKTPVGRAEVRTLVALAELADCKVDDLLIHPSEVQLIETGIKALDFFAPITKGGINGFVARMGMGQLVLLAEIFYRLKEINFTTILLMPDLTRRDLKEVKDNSTIVCENIESAYEEIKKISDDQNIALAADRSLVISGEIYSLLDQLALKKEKTITTFLVDPTGEAVDEELPYGPLDTLLTFDADLLSRKLLPPIDPVSSTSVITEGAQLDKEHLNLQLNGRKILRRYRELRFLVNAFGLEKLQPNDKTIYHRGERLEAFLTQSFFVSEPFTNRKGVTVPLTNTLDDIKHIIEGDYDNRNVEELMYIGSLNEANHERN